jgi:hypothetical protein
VRNDLKDNLITPTAKDEVVLEKGGFIITDAFVSNTQTKLYRGVSVFLETKNRKNRTVNFSQAIQMVNQHYPEHAFS